MNNRVRVSVIVPVFNAGPFLHAFVDSFLSQTLESQARELIAVDDGSTDDSGTILEAYAAEHSNVRVIHQANSGWPGKPRNVGIGAARGEYVFFADPDDEFGGPEALERLVDFADEHGSDVVVPKMVPKGGRLYAQWRYATTQIDADLVTCFTTLTPQKLFRRSFLDEFGIRFPEERVRLEDGQFLSQAYLRAKRVSILNGYDFYYIVHHPEQDHLSAKPVDPDNYIGSVAVMSENVEKYCRDPDLGDHIINEIYFRKVLANFTGARLLKHKPERQNRWLRCQLSYVDRFITDARYEKMGPISRARTELVRREDMDAIIAYARAEAVEFVLTGASSRKGIVGLQGRLVGDLDGKRLPQLTLVRRGSGDAGTSLPFVFTDDAVTAELPKSVLPVENATQRYDLWLSYGKGHHDRRIRAPKEMRKQQFTDSRTIEIYPTNKGNLSISVAEGLSRRERAKRSIARVIRR